MSTYTNLHLHSYYSLLDGLSSPDSIAKRCKEIGQTSCALTDHGSISGAAAFSASMEKNGIKPILGTELYLCPQPSSIKDQTNKKLSHLVILSKNKEGWSDLIKLTSKANSADNFYYKPRVNLDEIKDYANNLFSFSGHPGSDMANVLFESEKEIYNAKDISEVKLKPTAFEDAVSLANKYKDIFGDRFYLEIQLMDKNRLAAQTVIADVLREVSKKTGIKCVATADSHYCTKQDAIDQRVILCSALGVTMKKVTDSLKNDEDVALGGFFKSDNYHIPSEEEMYSYGNTKEEIENSKVIADLCDKYSILSNPVLPKYEWTDGMSEIDYLRHLCRIGWRKRKKNTWNQDVYANRVKMELDVIETEGLVGYFLIVQDYVNWAKREGILVGHGRGSAGGSLVAYLVGITETDPIQFNLMFERFYNKGRNTPGRVSLPDIDIDFPKGRRQDVIAYIKMKYGHDRVMPMATFGRMQGRGALKEVLRVHDVCDKAKADEITKNIPQEHEIEEYLMEMEKPSILRWTLENDPKILEDYCRLDDNNVLIGDYAQYIEQAIRIEGTLRSQGSHAAGIIISPYVLADVCPIVKGTKYDQVIGFDMEDLEKMGHVKFDILGLNALDKIQGVMNLLRTGKMA